MPPSQRVEICKAFAVPEVLDEAIENPIAESPDRAARRKKADAERRHPVRRQQIDIRKQHHIRNASRLGGQHAANAEHRTDHERWSYLVDGFIHIGGVAFGRADEQCVDQATDELPGIPALPVTQEIALRSAIGPVRRRSPAVERRTRRADVGRHGIVGEHRHRVPPLDEPPRGSELWRHIAAAVNESEQIPVGCHHRLPGDRRRRPPRMPLTRSRMIRSVSERDSCRSRRSSFHM
jgi:hypothetical protein